MSNNSNILNISLIYLSMAKNNTICQPDGGYSCVSTVPLTGIHSYPAIFSYPDNPPLNHWPNIISIIQSKQQQQNQHLVSTASSIYGKDYQGSSYKYGTTKSSMSNTMKLNSNLEYCNSVESFDSTYSAFSMGSTTTNNTANINNVTTAVGNSTANPNNPNNNLLQSQLGNSSTGDLNSAINKNEPTVSTNKTVISDRTSISSLTNAASLLMGTRRYNERRKRGKLSSNLKDNILDKDANQTLDETNSIPFFFYDWKVSVSYYMIKVDPEVVIVLIYECQNKDPVIIDFLSRLVNCLRNVTLFEQIKVDW